MIDQDFAAIDHRSHRIEEAARTIVSLCRDDAFGRGWRPKGLDEVAILLESLGYSSEVIAELWYTSLFDFARDVSREIEKYVTDSERVEQPDTQWFIRGARDYAIGALYSGPWIIAVVGLAVFGAALWSSLSTPTHLATAIAIGFYGALIVSGIFSQAIARRLTFYFLQENAALMSWTLNRFTLAALATIVVTGTTGWLLLRHWYGDQDAALAAIFYAGSAVFQTSLAPLYTLRRFWTIVGIAAAATVTTGGSFVLLFHRRVSVPWEPALLALEIAFIGGAVMLLTLRSMRKRAEASNSQRDLIAPAPSAVISAAAPYGTFGAAYFAMIVLDHLAAGFQHGTPFAYRAGYELGCDVALLAVIPVVGVINVALEALPRKILTGANAAIGHGVPFDRTMLRFYLICVAFVAGAGIVTVGLADSGGTFLLRHSVLGLQGSEGDEATFVLRYASIGYGMLMIGLLNSQLLFFLSRPLPAVAGALAGAAIVGLGGALIVATHAPAASAVFALDAGIAAFVAVTTAASVRTMCRFTFAYYAAY